MAHLISTLIVTLGGIGTFFLIYSTPPIPNYAEPTEQDYLTEEDVGWVKYHLNIGK